MLCSTESGVIVDTSIRQHVIDEFKKQKAYFVSADEKEKLARTMFDQKGVLNPDVVGKSPAFIAQKSGFTVPSDTTVLIAELSEVGKTSPLSREKLSPVLSFFTVDGWREGCHRCIEMLEFGGIGHTMVIHSSDQDIIMKFALEKPACRILVNTQSALGAVGYTNDLLPSLTLGPGTFGHSIISNNVSAKHLINIKRLAFETRPINKDEGTSMKNEKSVPQPIISNPKKENKPILSTTQKTSWMDEIEERIRLKAGNAPSQNEKVKSQKEISPATQDNSTTAVYGNEMSLDQVEQTIKKFEHTLSRK